MHVYDILIANITELFSGILKVSNPIKSNINVKGQKIGNMGLRKASFFLKVLTVRLTH